MESLFLKEHRMAAYAAVLNDLLKNPDQYPPGLCMLIRNFLRDEFGYSLHHFYFYEGDINFPELWGQRSFDAKVGEEWFSNLDERIQALRNILGIKEYEIIL